MALLTWDSGAQVLSFDATTSETNTSKSEKAEFPIERGAPISDAVVPRLPEVSLTVFVSNSPLREGSKATTTVQVPRIRAAKKSLTVTAVKYDRPPGPTPGAVVQKLVSVIGDALFGEGPDYKVPGTELVRELYGVSFTSRQRELKGDRRIALVDTLEKLRNDVTRIDVYTNVAYYPDCVLVGIDFRKDRPGDGLPIELTFSRINEVSTKRVESPPTRVSRAKAPEVKGAAGEDTKASKKSLAAKLLDQYGINPFGR